MITAYEILVMIEQVDVADDLQLDKIDALVNFYAACIPSVRETVNVERFIAARIRLQDNPKYTRSRDALKAIRPEGWYINLEPRFMCGRFDNGMGFFAFAIKQTGGEVIQEATFAQLGGVLLKTEELAELAAIIRAIAYERETF